MLACARLRHVAASAQWDNKKHTNMRHLEAALEDDSLADRPYPSKDCKPSAYHS